MAQGRFCQFCEQNMKFWLCRHCIATFWPRQKSNLAVGPLPHAKFHIYWSNVSLLWSKNPFLNHWVNAIPACCPAGRPACKNHTFHLQPARDARYHHTWQGDRGEPYHFCTPVTFSDPISSFANGDYWKFVGKCSNREKMLITWLFVLQKWPN